LLRKAANWYRRNKKSTIPNPSSKRRKNTKLPTRVSSKTYLDSELALKHTQTSKVKEKIYELPKIKKIITTKKIISDMRKKTVMKKNNLKMKNRKIKN
jgi:hypothetical protein